MLELIASRPGVAPPVPQRAAGTYPLPVPAPLIACYDGNAPRYTSYPTAAEFRHGFDDDAFRSAIAASNRCGAARDLSVYIHLPFCREACWYCACHRSITRRADRADRYLETLREEIAAKAALLEPRRTLRQLHLGGGTPTFYSPAALRDLIAFLGTCFTLPPAEAREWSIEIDPRTVTPEQAAELVGMGFDRVSLGIQDFDPRVQRAINRRQGVRDVRRVVAALRAAGTQSLSFDLIYGLPHQTPARFARTLRVVRALRPDRISVYAYAHMPRRFRVQSLMPEEALPDPATRLTLMATCHGMLTEAGYVHIGMDHFALPDDALVRAMVGGTMQRNFQGYSTHGDCELLGFGASAISHIGGALAQNASDIASWERRIRGGGLAVARGHRLTAEDHLRSDIIQALMCHGYVDIASLEETHGIRFDTHFGHLRRVLERMADDGLLRFDRWSLSLTERGCFLMRSVAVLFDAYRGADSAERFSRAI